MGDVMINFLCQLTRLWYLVVWWNTNLDVAVKTFLKIWLTFKSVDFEYRRLPSITWVGFIQSVEGLKSKDRSQMVFRHGTSMSVSLSLQLGSLAAWQPALWISNLPAPTFLWANSLHLLFSLYTFYWFYFSRELLLIQKDVFLFKSMTQKCFAQTGSGFKRESEGLFLLFMPGDIVVQCQCCLFIPLTFWTMSPLGFGCCMRKWDILVYFSLVIKSTAHNNF